MSAGAQRGPLTAAAAAVGVGVGVGLGLTSGWARDAVLRGSALLDVVLATLGVAAGFVVGPGHVLP